MVLVIPLVQHPEIAKGDIADGHIKETVGHLHLFKAGDGNGAVLIDLLGDASGDGIQFYTVGVTACHGARNHANEITHAAGRFYKDVIFDTSPVAGKVYKNSENRRKQGVSCGFRCICRCSICPIRAQPRCP